MSSFAYVGEINGDELYFGAINNVPIKFSRGHWKLDLNYDVPVRELVCPCLDTLRRDLITSHSLAKCSTAAKRCIEEICRAVPLFDFTRDITRIIESYLSVCYPWRVHPNNPAILPNSVLRSINVDNMALMSGPGETYRGVNLTRFDPGPVSRAVTDGQIKWYFDDRGVFNVIQQIILEARRKEILGQI